MERQHLIVIDMQVGHLESKPEGLVEKRVSVINHLVARAEEHGSPVTYVMFPESWYGKMLPSIRRTSNSEVVFKEEDDAFTSLPFLTRVSADEKLWVTGCNLEFCVYETVRSAVKRGFEVVAYKDAILARDRYSLKKVVVESYFDKSSHVQYLNSQEV